MLQNNIIAYILLYCIVVEYILYHVVDFYQYKIIILLFLFLNPQCMYDSIL